MERRRLGDPGRLDSGYDAPRIAHLLAGLPVQVLGRLRSDRVMRRPTPPRVYDPQGGRPPKHGGEFVFGDTATWGREQAVTITDTRLNGKASAQAWDRLTPRAAWLDHDGPLPIIEGTVIRLAVEHLPSGGVNKPVWLWWSGTGATATDVDRCWQSFLRRFDIEHVRHEARHNRVEVEDLRPRTFAEVRVKQGAACPGERRERVESSPDNAGTDRHRQTVRARQSEAGRCNASEPAGDAP